MLRNVEKSSKRTLFGFICYSNSDFNFFLQMLDLVCLLVADVQHGEVLGICTASVSRERICRVRYILFLEIRLFKISSDSIFKVIALSGYISKSKVINKTAGLPIIKCSCGYKILLLPSVKAMSQAIEAHVETHTLKIRTRQKLRGNQIGFAAIY